MTTTSAENSQSKDPEKEGAEKNYLTEGIALVLLSGAAYLSAYFYELAYADHYGIPAEFIKISVSNLLKFGAIAFTIAILLYQFASLLMVTLHNPDGADSSGYVRLARRHVFLLSFPLLGWFLSGFYFSEIYRIFWWNGLMFLADAIPAIALKFTTRGKQMTLNERLKSWLTTDKEGLPPSPEDFLKTKSARRLGVGAAAVVLFVFLSASAGLGEARRRDTFPINENREVLVRVYEDHAIVGKLAENEKVLLPAFRRVSLATVSEAYALTDIGRLKKTPKSSLNKPKSQPKDLGASSEVTTPPTQTSPVSDKKTVADPSAN